MSCAARRRNGTGTSVPGRRSCLQWRRREAAMTRRRLFHLGLWGPKVDEGVDWEIEHHIEERIDELMAEGRTRLEAEEEARWAFGDVAGVRREMRRIDRQRERSMQMRDVLGTVWQDVRYGLRGLVRDSTFTVSLILTMGLGIGANVGMF